MAVKSAKIDKEDDELKKVFEARRAQIKVIGVGGAGNNTITRLMQTGIVGVETIAVNTDAQDLLYTDADIKILIGKEITGGLGAGSDPKIGEESAKENREEIKRVLQNTDMVFVTCGLGGGTGTGASPVIADIAKKMGILTVGIVTLPFSMEGNHRMSNAKNGLEKLMPIVDTLIVIPNDKLLEVVPDVSLSTAFRVADEILVNSVKGITELVTKPGLVNLDFADVRAVMLNGGVAMIGMGESDSEERAKECIERALNNPLLDVEIDDAKGALINIFGGPDITIKECREMVQAVSSKLNQNAKVIWGAQIDKNLGDTVRVLVVVTGIKPPEFFAAEKALISKKKKEIEKILEIDFV